MYLKRKHPTDTNLFGCSKCKKYMGREAFAKNKSKKDGLSSECKECARAATRAYLNSLSPDEKKLRLLKQKEWKNNNSERYKQSQKAYREGRPEKIKEYRTGQSKEKIKEYAKRYYANLSPERKNEIQAHNRACRHKYYIKTKQDRQHPENINLLLCARCKQYKPKKDYGKCKHSKNGYDYECRACGSEQDKLYYKNMTIEQKMKGNEKDRQRIARASDGYVASLLKSTIEEIPPDLLALKRQELFLRRNIRRLKGVCNGLNISQNQRI